MYKHIHEFVQTIKFRIRERPHTAPHMYNRNEKKLQILEEINENDYKIDKGSEVPSIAVKKLVTKTHDHFHQ